MIFYRAVTTFFLLALLALPLRATELPERLPELLTDEDTRLYQQIFEAQELGNIKQADKLIAQLDNTMLMGHILSQRYLHPTAWRSRYSELRDWLDLYSDHPAASRIKWLADKRRPKAAAGPKQPKKGYLNGVGHHDPQSWRAAVPVSRPGRASPRKTAAIAAEVRRAIRRGAPTAAARYLSQSGNLRYLTKAEEGHLLGEIAHGYFVFGLDDKAIRTARQAIGKGRAEAYMAYWAGGLAAIRSRQPELAGMLFRTLAELEDAPTVLRSGAAFWAQRLALREGDFAGAMRWLDIAAASPKSFYGVMALQASGQHLPISFDLPQLSDDFTQWLLERRGGRRVFALLQTGNWTEAARELRYLYDEADTDRRRDMMVFAVQHNMPGLAFRLADIFRREKGILYYGALYPEPEVEVEFSVDRALLWAIARKESGFYPLARSRVRASGLMQIMPATAAFIGRDKRYRSSMRHMLHNPEVNLQLGQDYIVHLLNEPLISGNLVRMLAAYNGGPGNLNKWMRRRDHQDDVFLLIESIPARETRNYIKSVITDMWMYRIKFGEDTPALRSVIAGDPQAGKLAFLLSPAADKTSGQP